MKLGGLNVAFKNAVIGGVFLALIEGVSTVFTSISMRRQYQMLEEMQKQEMERIKVMNRKGGDDAWAVDYNKKYADSAENEKESLMDKAKSFSF